VGTWLCGAVLVACGESSLDLAGTVERRILELGAPVSEVIVDIPVAVGDAVAAGDVLVRLDSTVAEAELRAWQAAKEAAQATLREAEREHQRFEGLQRQRVATPQQLDATRRALDEARALIAEREARAAQATKRLADLTITARAAGLIDQLPFEVGERVPPGGVTAVVLADESPWVRVWIPAHSVVRVNPGDAAEVRVEGLAGWLDGTVIEVAHQPSYTPHYALTERESAHLVYEGRVAIVGAPSDLRPGLSARVRIALEDAPTVAAGD
jgi:HlyD family secretion protein